MWMKWMLLLIPATIAVEHFAPDRPLLVFVVAGLSVIPLAGWMGKATEDLASKTSEGVGGLLNATFGNAAELIIALAALRSGLHDVVKASLAGSIIGNNLLVLGAAMLAGGIRHREQRYNVAGARSQATMLCLAAIALLLPAAHRAAAGNRVTPELGTVSFWIAWILLAVYAANLVYSLVTHRANFAAEEKEAAHHEPVFRSTRIAIVVLLLATIAIAWMSEILVGALTPAAAAMGLNGTFVGVFVLAILGNAAEHSTAVTVAMKDRMDLALSIAVGSSVQVALFVAPVLVLASYLVGPMHMDLAFSGGLTLTMVLATWITLQVASDGRSDWLRGVQLLAVYLVLALVYLFAPGAP